MNKQLETRINNLEMKRLLSPNAKPEFIIAHEICSMLLGLGLLNKKSYRNLCEGISKGTIRE